MEDGLLFMEMRHAADDLARRRDGLDYSVQSLDALDAALAGAGATRSATRDAGAYLGEVLIRHGAFAWTWPPRYASERDTLRQFADQVLEYSSSPTEETAGRLGLKKKYVIETNWSMLRWDCQRFRARLRVSRQRVAAGGS